jgi:hypothetical protein
MAEVKWIGSRLAFFLFVPDPRAKAGIRIQSQCEIFRSKEKAITDNDPISLFHLSGSGWLFTKIPSLQPQWPLPSILRAPFINYSIG